MLGRVASSRDSASTRPTWRFSRRIEPSPRHPNLQGGGDGKQTRRNTFKRTKNPTVSAGFFVQSTACRETASVNDTITLPENPPPLFSQGDVDDLAPEIGRYLDGEFSDWGSEIDSYEFWHRSETGYVLPLDFQGIESVEEFRADPTRLVTVPTDDLVLWPPLGHQGAACHLFYDWRPGKLAYLQETAVDWDRHGCAVVWWFWPDKDPPTIGVTARKWEWDLAYDWLAKNNPTRLNEMVETAKRKAADRGKFLPDLEGEPFGNAKWEATGGEGDGPTPRTMPDVLSDLESRFHGWPRSCGGSLFVPDGQGGTISFTKPAELFGFIQRYHRVQWRSGAGMIGREEFVSGVIQTVQRHKAIETVPHEPPVPDHFYLCEMPQPGDGRALSQFVDFFLPETPLDRELVTAAVCTPFWGGAPGARPLFMATADGRGYGKTVFIRFAADLYQGCVDVSDGEDIEGVKKRLLSNEAECKRIVTYDNIKSLVFSWSGLEGLLTSPVVSGWRLYHGEGQRPNLFTWFCSLNGPNLSADLAARTVEIQFRKPEYRPGWTEEVHRFIQANRQAVYADIVAFLRRPADPIIECGRWAAWEQAVLARVDHPLECYRLICSRRNAIDTETEEVVSIEDHFAAKLGSLGYLPNRCDAFLPTSVVARWYNEATGEKRKTVGVTMTLKRYAREGKLFRLVYARAGPDGERGWRWVGEHCDSEELTDYGVRKQIAKQIEDRKSRPDSEPAF